MQANIIEGVYVRIGGDTGRTNGLSWSVLETMFGHLQQLIEYLAKYELESEESPSLKDFEIEIFDFKRGSAVPAFRLVPKSQNELIPFVTNQRRIVADKFDRLMSIANTGNYDTFFSPEVIPEVKYEIAEELNGFILSAKNSPISIVRPINNNGDFSEIYNIKRFTREQSENLLKPRIRRSKLEEPEQILGLIQRTGKRKKILDLYESKDAILSIAPPQIILKNKIYHLHTPLLCTVQKEDDHYIVENELLDLYGTGLTIDEAEHDLYIEFDESYLFLNSLSDAELSERLIRAKTMINTYIKEITE